MVNVAEWINQNYPENGVCQRQDDKENYGKTRAEIVNLDISSQNLEGSLCLSWPGFTNLRKLNISNNKINCGLIGDYSSLEEIDYSYNQHSGIWGINAPLSQLKKLNLSYNRIEKVDLSLASHLNSLDCSSNSLSEIILNSRDLQVLNCSNNPIIKNLTLTYSPNLVSFDCLGTKLVKADTTTSIFDTTTPTISDITTTFSTSTLPAETVYVNNPQAVIGLATPLGISVLGWIGLGTFFCYKKWRGNKGIPTPGSN